MAVNLRQLEHILALVAASLREVFPHDYYKRCTYSALAILSLLRETGEDAIAVGGEFVAFVLSRDGLTPTLKGFSKNGQGASHFWVETADRLIDVNSFFLPDDATIPATPMPAVAWPKSEGLPRYLRYRALAVMPQGHEMDDDSLVSQRGRQFVQLCRERFAAQTELMKFPTWVVTGKASVSVAATRGNLWAKGAERFNSWVDPAKLPF